MFLRAAYLRAKHQFASEHLDALHKEVMSAERHHSYQRSALFSQVVTFYYHLIGQKCQCRFQSYIVKYAKIPLKQEELCTRCPSCLLYLQILFLEHLLLQVASMLQIHQCLKISSNYYLTIALSIPTKLAFSKEGRPSQRFFQGIAFLIISTNFSVV